MIVMSKMPGVSEILLLQAPQPLELMSNRVPGLCLKSIGRNTARPRHLPQAQKAAGSVTDLFWSLVHGRTQIRAGELRSTPSSTPTSSRRLSDQARRPAPPCMEAQPSGRYDETGWAASYTSTCASHDVTEFSAPTRLGRITAALCCTDIRNAGLVNATTNDPAGPPTGPDRRSAAALLITGCGRDSHCQTPYRSAPR